VGLRFAGSGDEDARDAVLHFAKLFLTLGGKSVAELAGRSTLEACLCVCLLAAGMVRINRTFYQIRRYFKIIMERKILLKII
jgi:anaphase-promoting complex subunit 1